MHASSLREDTHHPRFNWPGRGAAWRGSGVAVEKWVSNRAGRAVVRAYYPETRERRESSMGDNAQARPGSPAGASAEAGSETRLFKDILKQPAQLTASLAHILG